MELRVAPFREADKTDQGPPKMLYFNKKTKQAKAH